MSVDLQHFKSRSSTHNFWKRTKKFHRFQPKPHITILPPTKPAILQSSRPLYVNSRLLTPSKPHRTMLLRVETEYFIAGAVWEFIHNCWSCTRTAPILHWMKGMTPDQAKLELVRLNANIQWIPISQPSSANPAELVAQSKSTPSESSGPGRDEPKQTCETNSPRGVM